MNVSAKAVQINRSRLIHMGNAKHRSSAVSSVNTRYKGRKEADVVSNKIMAAFSISLIGTFGLMIMRNRVAAQGPTTMLGLKILSVLGLLVAVGGFYMGCRGHKQGEKGYYWYNFLGIAGLAAAVCAVLLLTVGYKICSFLAFILPVIAIYYFLSTVFSRENFVILLLGGLGSVLMWYCFRVIDLTPAPVYVLFGVFFVLLLAVLVPALSCKKLRCLFDNKSHLWLTVTVVLMAAMSVLALALGAVAAYVTMFVALAYTVLQIVIMTVKM